MGKSTTAQLLGRAKGYVYYEGDCFLGGRNPYIPLDAPDPSMAILGQKFLQGEGMEDRIQPAEVLMKIIYGCAFPDQEQMEPVYELMCKEILRERNRIGGDWVVATCVTTRKSRDLLR